MMTFFAQDQPCSSEEEVLVVVVVVAAAAVVVVVVVRRRPFWGGNFKIANCNFRRPRRTEAVGLY